MNVCTVQRGIFSLRTCGNASTDHCAQCMQAICFEHANYGREQVLCPKCSATEEEEEDGAEDDSDTETADWESSGWSSRWSSDYRETHNTVPLAAGSPQAGFDELDRNAFATRSDGVMDDGDGDGPAGSLSSFADS